MKHPRQCYDSFCLGSHCIGLFTAALLCLPSTLTVAQEVIRGLQTIEKKLTY